MMTGRCDDNVITLFNQHIIFSFMKKNLLLLAVLMVLPLVAAAYDFSAKNADGVVIYYDLNKNGKDCSVTFNDDAKYKGMIAVPATVVYQGKTLQVTAIGPHAFEKCDNLYGVSLPEGIVRIEEDAFFGSKLMSDINFPSTLKSIGNRAFNGCTFICANDEGLGNVELNEGLEEIGDGVFARCDFMYRIVLPQSLKRIGQYAFLKCDALSTIVLPENLEYIGTHAIVSGLKNLVLPMNISALQLGSVKPRRLEKLYSINPNPTAINGKDDISSLFPDHIYEETILMTPPEAVEKYKNTEGWKDFKHIEPWDLE